MRVLKFFSLCRSGHHAVIFWFINNLGGCVEVERLKKYTNSLIGLEYYNNVVVNKPKLPLNCPCLIVSFEDQLYDNSENSFVIVRDFYNMLASRYKRFGELLAFRDGEYIRQIDELIAVWKQHASHLVNNDDRAISYGKWLLNKKYRDNIAQKLSSPNTVDNIDYVPIMGKGSSFVGLEKEKDTSKYFTRYLQVDLPERLIKVASADKELRELNTEILQNYTN